MSDLNPLTSAELSDLKAKAKAATPGTWYADLSGDHYHTDAVWAKLLSGEPNHICLVGASELEQQNANAEYIAAANPQTILRLIAMIERPDAWQPIETAPKDQTPVFVAVPWPRAPTGWLTGEARFEPEMRDGSWWWANMSESDFDGPGEAIIPAPTHWQPLPAPPSEASAATEPK